MNYICSWSESPPKKIVIEYLLDSEAHIWSVRRAKIMTNRIKDTTRLIYMRTIDICNWKSTPKTIFVFLCVMVSIFFDMVLSSILLGILITVSSSSFVVQDCQCTWTKISQQCSLHIKQTFADKLDTYLSSQSADDLRLSYDKVRKIEGAGQTILAQVASMIANIS